MTRKLIGLIIFSIAFGFVEAAVVFYLRKLFGYQLGYAGLPNYSTYLDLGFISFVSPTELIFNDKSIYFAEILREIATLVMLAVVAYISSQKVKQRWAVFIIIFSIWDIFYYIFLRFLTGWPNTLFDKDIFFLIPTPWVGPIIFPLTFFSLLFILGVKIYFSSLRPASQER